MNVAPTLGSSRTALPPEGPPRLRPGKAGSVAGTCTTGERVPFGLLLCSPCSLKHHHEYP